MNAYLWIIHELQQYLVVCAMLYRTVLESHNGNLCCVLYCVIQVGSKAAFKIAYLVRFT